jgi:hypothetical protein
MVDDQFCRKWAAYYKATQMPPKPTKGTETGKVIFAMMSRDGALPTAVDVA